MPTPGATSPGPTGYDVAACPGGMAEVRLDVENQGTSMVSIAAENTFALSLDADGLPIELMLFSVPSASQVLPTGRVTMELNPSRRTRLIACSST